MRATYLFALLAATLAAAAPAPATDPNSVEMIGIDGNIITVPAANVTWGSGAADSSLHARAAKCSKGWSECSWINKYGCFIGCCRLIIV
ncbi:uncharacterized protein LOC62_06G008472 [Vanrija pseudolonga]|uniref:Uncharacterized protein n=1 Tax=Vanrija pseudolonga TaxID=143232 RepID=A0AAF0YDU4_9TREE|nr:hypothetical protein LOC62_06G008472 [Vanrija pseudolonga]